METITPVQANKFGEKLFDLSMIRMMCRDDEEKVKKLVTVFIGQMPGSIEEIESAYQRRDFATVKKIVHHIKPTLSYYAVVSLEKDILRIEDLAEEEMAGGELELKIKKLSDVVNRIVMKMKNEFSITQ